MIRATISSVAHYVPPDKYPNTFFEQHLDTTDEWIQSRTGIVERRFLKDGATSDMIVPAAKKCIEQRGIGIDDIDCIIVSTITPDYVFPSTAAMVQTKLGMKNTWGFDLSAACSGFIFALVTAVSLVESGVSKRCLLCGADKMSSILDMKDRTTSVLFGDGAGVVLIEASEDNDLGVMDSILKIDGEGQPYLHMKAGGSVLPASEETVRDKLHCVYQDGKNVFKAAVKGMADISLEIMKKNDLYSDDIAWFVPHQANLRIIKATSERMKLDMNKVMVNIEKYGNTTAATIPICLSEWHEAGKIKKGDKMILSSFGAGYTWGAVYLKWNLNNY